MNKETKKAGLGFLPILSLIFITLKLMGYIAWSWWWVTAPLWAPFAIIATLAAVMFMFVGAATCWEKRRR
ncbi:hypothetical protein [Serratia ureilytica]|uniref:Transmembrane Fragile-X-F family protein n=1 Tax=Serratia ureilytica TaxID=300181 RepID=A0A9X9G1J6_9GAMM|nr:hypothetical protein [Serratia ureilytica]TXE26910.1 hypothetical protein FOT63_18410 [Serratia ureilytica]